MNYDQDLGPVLVTDWLHKDAFSLFQLELLGRPPTPDSNLLNGKGPYYCCPSLDEQCTGNTPFTEFNFTKGSSYKMSLVNTAVITHFTFWIDDHDFYVVATDFVPIHPYLTSTIYIAIGQRYDIGSLRKIEHRRRPRQTIGSMPVTATMLGNGLASESFDMMLTTKTSPFQLPLTDFAMGTWMKSQKVFILSSSVKWARTPTSMAGKIPWKRICKVSQMQMTRTPFSTNGY